MSRLPLVVLAIGTVLGLAACSFGKGNSRESVCATERDDVDTRSVEPVRGVEAVAVPESSAAMKIPPPTRAEAAAVRSEKVNRRTACLDFPPPLPAPTTPAAPAAAGS